MELTKEQIQKIDSFLQGIGVEYLDIRLEMVDHIATEIEEKVNDIDAFFENNRFETPFIKYMLSRKSTFYKNYKRQIKKSYWANTKKVSLDILKEAIKPVNLILISFLFTTIFFLEKLEIKLITRILSLVFFVSYMYISILFKNFKKKLGNVGVIDTYTSFLVFTFLVSFYFPLAPIFDNDNFTAFHLYKISLMLTINFFVYKSYLNKRKQIMQDYKKLI